ncbi:MAG TPA: amino acid ABC transporter permease [Microthrixaceae bacterium]|nr:amino acid ABC transporter permease [Microthrixaceae bacterium]MCB9399876.1 amino acid ABC transporter permease [Microthrixaceae bacterium]MCO5304723.1 amino acid ABC transporter permease [Microthrixaceae bacterium]HMR96924.1 amino acid ABC transporter permease [Microthrixaceae bacterium]HMX65264.1 amino acid ABC transporter permease [Microthrixaceae bacterium]
MTRSQRSNLIQWALFVAGLALVALVLGVTVRWGDLADRFFKWEDFTDQFPGIVTEAARNTLVYTAIGYLGGLVIGLVVALMRQSQVPPARVIASVYIEVFRALPALLTILIVGFGLPIAFGAENLPGFLAQPWGAGCLALALVAGAYLAETIRAGIEAVPRGQVEAARSLGMPTGVTMRSIVLPQAFRVILPPLTNELVLLLKDTSLLAVLGVAIGQRELTTWGRTISNAIGNYTPLIAAAVCYLVITLPLTFLARWVERRTQADRR